MIETRVSRRRRPSAVAFAVAHLLTLAACGVGGEETAAPAQRGRGLLVAPYDAITACDAQVYRGPQTPLYSDRPYHTVEPVEVATGHAFCRGARHGTQVWLLDVERPTALLAFGAADNGLAERGWTRLAVPLRIEAAGVPFDSVYTRTVGAGRHVIRQGFTPSAPIVLWDPDDAHPAR